MAPEQLESLPPAADLFDARVTDEDGVPLWLPYNQGDVFEGVPLPSLNGVKAAGLVMLFLHPCTMRRGADMAPRLTVLDVRQVSGKRPLERLSRVPWNFGGGPMIIRLRSRSHLDPWC